ncbi:hypothetical protein J7I84_06900 [Arthrobacter sp. ISL-85]|nr:hypothetical protein [Arthrobacter sp. ISL-85]
MLLSFEPVIRSGLGIDLDSHMVTVAVENGRDIPNVSFVCSSHELENVNGRFDVALNRHAPFALKKLPARLKTGGVFITQQVGERNMANVKQALGQTTANAPIAPEMFDDAGLDLLEFCEYDVDYVVQDIESLIFWLGALDLLHADVDGSGAIADVDAFNAILHGSVTEREFVTNEHRYLAVARARS